MSKGHRRRPFDQKKWAKNFDSVFGVKCSQCGERVAIHLAKPLHSGRGETGILCLSCRDNEAVLEATTPKLGLRRIATVNRLKRIGTVRDYRVELTVEPIVAVHKGMRVSCGLGWPGRVLDVNCSDKTVLIETEGVLFLGTEGSSLFVCPEPGTEP